ncbi:MAG TPA: hypothetical protein VND23_02830 [Acidimicrobiales bacterium]|nr:hypothetical protein [Acidimicrobiales bacterium]
MSAAIGKYVSAFGRFWWDFLVGDTPEVFVGVLVVVGAALALRHERAAAVVLVPLLAVAVLAMSTYRGRKRA